MPTEKPGYPDVWKELSALERNRTSNTAAPPPSKLDDIRRIFTTLDFSWKEAKRRIAQCYTSNCTISFLSHTFTGSLAFQSWARMAPAHVFQRSETNVAWEDGVLSAVSTGNVTIGGECRKFVQKVEFQEGSVLLIKKETTSFAEESNKACVGKPAPQFKTEAVVGGEHLDVALSDYKGKYVVLLIYPLDFTFVCPTEIIAFSERAAEFHAINTVVLAASIGSLSSHLAWINQPRKHGGLGEMNIPVLADTNHTISRDYGVLKEDEGIAYRGLFLIDPQQNLRQITINDLPVGYSVDDTLRLVQAFQFVEKHGEVCPAGWTPGADTIKPGVKESQEYFKKH